MRQAEGRRISAKRIVLLIATVLAIVFIFGQSMLPQEVSAEESGWFRTHVMEPTFGLFGLEPPSHHAVRKIAHVAEFTVLSLLLALCFRGRIAVSAGVGFAAAFLDESLQVLTARGAQITDVWIDLCGVALGSLLGFLVLLGIRRRQKRARNSTNTDNKASHSDVS